MATTGTNPDGSTRKRLDQLARAVYHREMWPTPCAKDGNPYTGGNLYRTKTGTVRARNQDGTSSNRGLAATVMWPTPNASDRLQANMKDDHDVKRGYLRGVVLESAPNGGQLNPTWVEWLMGFPLGWTDLKDSETQ